MLDVSKIRQDFPILSRKVNGKTLIYLDNAATSQKPLSVINAERDLPMLHGQIGLKVGDSQYGWDNLAMQEQNQFVVQGWGSLDSKLKEGLTEKGWRELSADKKSQLVVQGIDYLDDAQKKELTKKGWKSLDYSEKAGLAKDVIGDALQEGYQKIGSLFENLKERFGMKNEPST